MFFQFSWFWLQRINFQIKSGFNKESHQDKSCKKTSSKEKRRKRRASPVPSVRSSRAALLPSGFPPRKMVMLPPYSSTSRRRWLRLSLNKFLLFLKGNMSQKHESSNIFSCLAQACFHFFKNEIHVRKLKLILKWFFFLHNAEKFSPDIKHFKIKVTFFQNILFQYE